MSKFTPDPVEKDNPHYNPTLLLDTVMQLLRLKYDRHLALRLEVLPSQICKIRKRRLSISPAILISMHEETLLSLRELRALMGDFREHTRPSAKHPLQAPKLHRGAPPALPWKMSHSSTVV